MSRYLHSYYHDFDPTGQDEIDAILEAVARAGKAFHSTAEWSESSTDDYNGPSYWDVIQAAANKAAEALKAKAAQGEGAES